ncbi:YraN family protein [Clostridium guangxiense]|uniref:YraN family protein n=1 Tax=Clostridium guangxiense TaxID=1662055 RepID=UPI001E364C59|nr:YraN family protein [Clostridium guangxiense]MCD2345987.1 YraN family protein [Clostridium guangxiense]
MYKKTIGNYGEEVAKEHLEESGYTILDRNFRCRTGEIDIIAEKHHIIIFAEVKSRYNSLYGNPCESVNYLKRLKIYKTAKFYIIKNNLMNFDFRFDVIEIILNYKNNKKCINHIKNAFQI